MRPLNLALVALFAMSMNIYAGKIKWDKNGNPILEKPTKPVKGCQKQDLDELLKDKNDSKCKK